MRSLEPNDSKKIALRWGISVFVSVIPLIYLLCLYLQLPPTSKSTSTGFVLLACIFALALLALLYAMLALLFQFRVLTTTPKTYRTVRKLHMGSAQIQATHEVIWANGGLWIVKL